MKLSAPLRVSWDWNWPPVVQPRLPRRSMTETLAGAIAGELASARVLMLEVGYPGIEDFRTGRVISVMRQVPAQTSLVLSAETVAAAGRERPWEEAGAAEVWADVTPASGKAPARDLPLQADGSVWPALRLYLTSLNGRWGGQLVRRAVEGGCRKLSLPIPPLFGSFLRSTGDITPSWRNLVDFADGLNPLLSRFPDLDLRVHNQALWTILKRRGFRAAESEAPGHTGCQAASALAYIDPSGTLYPCSALPVPLGRVEPGALERMWGDRERARLRQAIEKVPPACGECPHWETCRGGCRGWAHFTRRSWREPGPDCWRMPDGARSAP